MFLTLWISKLVCPLILFAGPPAPLLLLVPPPSISSSAAAPSRYQTHKKYKSHFPVLDNTNGNFQLINKLNNQKTMLDTYYSGPPKYEILAPYDLNESSTKKEESQNFLNLVSQTQNSGAAQ